MARYGDSKGLDYGALLRELERDGPQRLYLLWGEEDYLLRSFVRRVEELCLKGGSGDFDAKRLDGPVIDLSELEEALNAMPFFGGRTYLELRGFDINRCRDERLGELLSDVPEWCTVVITLPSETAPDGRLSLIKQLKNKGKAVEFTAQETSTLYRWLRRRAEAHGKTVERPAMDRLLALSGELMTRLIPEIEKICAYAAGEEITVADVEAVAHRIPEAETFAMTQCVARGDSEGAAAHLAELLAGDREPMEILGAIAWQMRLLYACRVAQEEGLGVEFVRSVTGVSEFRTRQNMDCARRFSLEALADGVRLCAELCMHSREQGAALSDVDVLREFLIRFTMVSRHA